jgi:hypothetical protein
MHNSNMRDPFTYPYLSALSTPNEDFYIFENPLRSHARQPTPSEDAAAHGSVESRRVLESPLIGMTGNLVSITLPSPSRSCLTFTAPGHHTFTLHNG